MHRVLIALYALLCKLLLPPAFRAEFAGELAVIVTTRVRSARGSRRSVVALLELLDLLRTVLREWHRVFVSVAARFGNGTSVDVRVAARSLAKAWKTTGIAVATIAIAIGASTAVYSVLDGVLLTPLDYPAADRIVRVAIGARPESGTTEGPFSPRGYWHVTRNTRAFEVVGAAGVVQRPLTGDGPPVAVEVALMTRSAFEVIGVDPQVGRLPTPGEALPGGRAVTLISHALWQGRYGADPSVLGRTVTLGPEVYEVIGVMPPGYAFPAPGTDAWILRQLDPASDNFRSHFLTVVARLAPGVSIRDATTDTERLIASFTDIGYGPTWFEEIFTGAAIVRPLRDEIVGEAREPILVVLATVGLLLVVAYTSVASLLLVRAEDRREERALRGALGAGRIHLVRSTLVESALLAVPGAVLGIALAAVGTRALTAIGPAAIPRLTEIRIDTSVLLFTTSITLGGVLLFGLVPAILGDGSVARESPFSVVGRGGSVPRARSRIQDGLTCGQIALAVMLLAAAGSLIRTLSELQAIDPGFRAENVLTFRLSPSAAKYPNPEASARFYDQLLERVRELPGVAAAGAVTDLPLTGGGGVRGAMIGNVPGVGFFVRRATPGYFEAMGIPVLRGRGFVPDDHDERLGSVVISESIDGAFWPHETALGKRIETWGAPATVVGVVGDVHEVDLRRAEQVIYKPLLDSVGGGGLALTVVVRSADEPADLTERLREVVASLDADLPVADVRMMASVLSDALSRTSFTMALVTLAAAIALFLATIGIYGVLSYVVSQRRREMAVRLAIGAERREVLALVVSRGLRVAALGLLVGAAGAVLFGRVLRSLLSDVRSLDVVTFGSVTLILLLASIAASLGPAIRSGNTSPADALREEV